MENPKQLIYATEELFRLKPETINSSIVDPSISPLIIKDMHSDATVIPATQPNFWIKYKWPIAGISIMAMWIGIFIYIKKQQDKEKLTKK